MEWYETRAWVYPFVMKHAQVHYDGEKYLVEYLIDSLPKRQRQQPPMNRRVEWATN